MNIYLDIETIPSQRNDVRDRIWAAVEPPGQYRKPESIEKWMLDNRDDVADEKWRRTALDGGYGEIVCVCLAVGEGEVKTFSRPDVHLSERTLLYAVFDTIRNAMHGQFPTYVGHCIGFDLRFLFHRAIVNSVKPTTLPYNEAPWRGRYVDTMYEWCGAKGSIKLTELCDVLGIDDFTDEIDGSQVWDAFRAGRIEQIEQHCRADVERVRAIWQRMQVR